jgi:predicted cupin superfamily sugar epimerase
MDIQNAAFWIDYLQLQPHPEGGYYKEVFRSEIEVSPPVSAEKKQAITSIYYLLEGKDFSGFHRIASDELWYFHKGVPLNIHVLDGDGNHIVHELSDKISGNLFLPVKAGVWFAAQLPTGYGYTLVSCAVAPGFDFKEFELAKKEQLLAAYPQHSTVIEKFCRF